MMVLMRMGGDNCGERCRHVILVCMKRKILLKKYTFMRSFCVLLGCGVGVGGALSGLGCDRGPEAGAGAGAGADAARVSIVEDAPGDQGVVVAVSGMHCDGCSTLLSEKLAGAQGIKNVRVSYAESKAWFTLDGAYRPVAGGQAEVTEVTGEAGEAGTNGTAGMAGAAGVGQGTEESASDMPTSESDPRVASVIAIIEAQGYAATVTDQ